MKKLLIIDDSSEIRNRIAAVSNNPRLADLKIVGNAKHGADALLMARQFMPDIATTDLSMPNMDGVNCIRGLMRISPDIRILVISSLPDRKTVLQALTAGALGFLRKPFSNDDLLEALVELADDAAVQTL